MSETAQEITAVTATLVEHEPEMLPKRKTIQTGRT